MEGTWTLRELQDRVERALSSDYEAPMNGQVRDVPDARTIRWYQTVGLVDRPSSFAGRTAHYGARHLLQIVAIKRLQSSGLKLRDVQARLLGQDDRALARISMVSESLLSSDAPSSTFETAEVNSRRRTDAFWSARGSRLARDTVDTRASEGEASQFLDDEERDADASVPAQVLSVQAQTALTLDDITISFQPARALGDDDKAAIADAIAALRKTLTSRGILRVGKKGDRA